MFIKIRCFVLAAGALLLLAGCDSKQTPNESAERETASTGDSNVKQFANPVGSLKIASRHQQWDEAWEAAKAVLAEAGVTRSDSEAIDERQLAESGIEPRTLVLIARAAHEQGHEVASLSLLKVACAGESYANEKRLHQTVLAMISSGRYFDALVLLEKALKVQPSHHESRRWLFDFYIGADDRVAAIPHGIQLVRARKFDVELLDSLSNTERRTLEAEPLDKMVERHPDDQRPLLGAAKAKFDESKFAEAIEILRGIVKQHPEHLPSQVVLGQSLAAAGRLDELEAWAAQQREGIEDYPGYWIALGDYARANGDLQAAVRAFAQAAACTDPDVVQIWTRLATLLPQLDADQSLIDGQTLTMVNQRAQQLGRFHQLKDRFTRTGGISRAIAVEIAKTLEQLGRLWEAEAWASLAMTLPEDDSVDVAGYRDHLVKQLDPATPWRVAKALPDFNAVLLELPLPAIESVVSRREAARGDSAHPNQVGGTNPKAKGISVNWRLAEQAKARGLDFWGRTGEHLDQPGIMLYQTLGCGGGTIDFDLDGWSDLYLLAAGGTPPEKDSQPNALFRNLAGKFQAVSSASMTDDRGFGQGVAVGDINEDGFPDLLVLNYGINCLFINNGDGTFGDVSEQLPANDAAEWSTSGAIADLDSDGLSDIAIVNYCAGLDPVTKVCDVKDTEIFRSCSPMLFAASPDRLVRNQGNGSFQQVTKRWGFESDSPGRGLGIVVGQLDGKTGNDLLIANDMTSNHYWSQIESVDDRDEFSLAESAMLRGLGGDDRGIPQGSMGIATADLDQDGDIDFYVTNFDNEYNTLHQQVSPGLWQDETRSQNLVETTRPLVAFGTEAIDLDNDGRFEVVLTNGHVDLFSRGDDKVMYDQPMQIFEQSADKGGYRDVDLTSMGGYFDRPHVGRALWTLDANRDGKLDFAVTHQTEPIALLINQTPADKNWIRVKLRGTRSSRDAIGAVVELESDSWQRTSFRLAGDGYQCSNEEALHFGLGGHDGENVNIRILWPSGVVQTVDGLSPRREHLIVEPVR